MLELKSAEAAVLDEYFRLALALVSRSPWPTSSFIISSVIVMVGLGRPLDGVGGARRTCSISQR